MKSQAAQVARAAPGERRTCRPRPRGALRSFPADELVEDFRLACVSRALDDREILLQKQSRVFFQISGAGHEILLLALARSLRPAYDWFFPYYRDRALVLALGVTPLDIMLQAVGSAVDPASGGRQMPCHWGDGDAQHRHPVEPDRAASACPAVGCAEAGRYIARRPACRAASPTATRSPTCRWARAPPPRASSGRASTPPAACTCPRSSSWPTTGTPSRCAPRTSRRRPSPSWCAASGAWR